MKFLVLFMILFSMGSFAAESRLAKVLDSKEMIELTEKLNAKGLQMLSLKDVYVEKGVRPRCPCDLYEVTFVKKSFSTPNTTVISREVFLVKAQGFGSNLRIVIEKLRRVSI
jgi:hypothetical protein